MADNYFTELYSINVSSHVEKKNGLDYLSWGWAWAELKKAHPEALFTIYENKDGLNYHHDGKTAWVKTGVTVNGIEYIEYLPVMDFRNQSIPLEKITSTAVNKTIQRSLTKAVARHGLGLSLYVGEDIPCEDNSLTPYPRQSQQVQPTQVVSQPSQPVQTMSNTMPQPTQQQHMTQPVSQPSQPVMQTTAQPMNIPSAEELTKSVLNYMSKGVLVGTFADKANIYIQTKDANGLYAVVNWCERQIAENK